MNVPIVDRLREVIAALDRRRPRPGRRGEMAIARDASALRARAVERLQELDEPGPGETSK